MAKISKSEIWNKMRDYYNQVGPLAWQDEIVPLDISSNKKLAHGYASLICQQIIDFKKTNPIINEPFYIIEAGAGHGKFGFYILKILEALLQFYEIPLSTIKYVMTDISKKNMETCKSHTALHPYVQKGILDFACFDILNNDAIELMTSKQIISKNALTTPIIMIANYLFDSLEHDAFQIINGKLHEVHVDFSSDATDHNEYFEKGKFTFQNNPIQLPYYGNDYDKILNYYLDYCYNSSFYIPIGALQAINNIQQLTQSHLCVISADKAVSNIDLLEGHDDPDIAIHGSISMTVNFDAIARYFKNKGGIALLTENSGDDFQVACFISKTQNFFAETKLTYYNQFQESSPNDIFAIGYQEDDINNNFETLDEILGFLKLSLWDPNIFCDFAEILIESLEKEDISLEQEKNIILGLNKVWEFFFKLESSQDLAFEIGRVYYHLEFFEKSISFYEKSLDIFGQNLDVKYNMAICYIEMKQPEKAIDILQNILAEDNQHQLALELKSELA